MWRFLLACAGDGPEPTEPTEPPDGATSSTADTAVPDDSGAPPAPTASCARTDHPLRVSCAAPGPFEVTLRAPGAPDRTASGQGEALVWALKPETTYTWSIGAESGAVTTGALGIPQVDVEVTGAAWGFDAVVQSMFCGGDSYAVAIDGDGDVVWYEQLPATSVAGYDWSAADRSFLAVTNEGVIEVAWDGARPLHLLEGADYAGPAHHDAHRWGRYTYLLLAEAVRGSDGQDYVVDAVEVFDGPTPVGRVSLADLYDPGQVAHEGQDGFWEGVFPGAIDWSHGNSVEVIDGVMILSLRWLDSVLALDGDPRSPTFGARRWLAAGSDVSLPDPDFRGSFEGQHHGTRVGDDLYLFDNGPMGTPSRALRLALDAGAGTATPTGEWRFGYHCPIQGGAYALDGGGVLATCATRAEVFAFAEGASTPAWTLSARCNAFSQTLRGIPIRF